MRAILFDRDGTLIDDLPYNNDAKHVRPRPGARIVLDGLRAAGIPIGVITNQSGVARGLITLRELSEVNARVEELLGPFDVWEICVHGPADGCACRKPAPGMVLSAAARLGVRPADCVVIGDAGRDVAAAQAAGARGVLMTSDLESAVRMANFLR